MGEESPAVQDMDELFEQMEDKLEDVGTSMSPEMFATKMSRGLG